MTRINTNVGSLIAQTNLGRSNDQLQTALTRLSTGLRINSGKDDPAGLIASENLGRDITAANKAISNSERAGQLIATADSALSQISGLLNDIRGLVTEAANSGVLSDEQIAANQLQVDSSLDAIDRISQVTTFQGRKLLDGSLDFQTTYSAGGNSVQDLNVNQANLGATGSVAVNVDITGAATQAQITNTGFGPSAATQATGPVGLTSSSGVLSVTAAAGGAADGVTGNGTDFVFQAAAGIAQAGKAVALTNSAGTIQVDAVAGGVADGAIGNATDVVLQAASGITQASGTATLTGGAIDINAVAGGAADGAAGTATSLVFQAATDIAQSAGTYSLGATGGSIDLTAANGGTAYDGLSIVIADSGSPTSALYDSNTNTLTINVLTGDSVQDIADAIDADGTFTTSGLTGAATPYDNTDNGTTNLVTSGGDDGTTAASYAGGTITVNVGIGALNSAVATVINNLADFNATATSGGGVAFNSADFGTSTPLSGGSDGTLGATYDANTNVITVNVAAGSTLTQIAAQIDGLADFSSSATAGGGNAFDFGDAGSVGPLAGGNDGTTSAAYAAGTVTTSVALHAKVSDVATAINSLADFNATATSGATNNFNTADFTGPYVNQLSGGADAGANDVLNADLVLKAAGASGAQVFNFQAGTTVAQVVSAINLVSDSTGVSAAAGSGSVNFQSSAYGSAAFVDLEVISEGTGGTFKSGLSATRSTGTDVQATVNGFSATGKGNTLSINTPVLDFSLTVADGSTTDVAFNINGGGAQLQLGPTVVTTEQARIGVNSVNTGKLGGVDGRLYQLRSGGSAALAVDPTTASRITDEAINKVTSLRGRFGAFQHATIDTNIASLKDTVANLTEAQSSIRDADFAKESAALTRAQILVQSGTAVLQIANQSPQQVLSLLRG